MPLEHQRNRDLDITLTLRSKILVTTCVTVVGALVLSGAVTYTIIRTNMIDAINENLSSIASSNTTTISQWIEGKERAVSETAAVAEHGDPQGMFGQMSRNDGLVVTAGWSDRTFFSTVKTPPDYDPTVRPWYKAAMAAGKLIVTRPSLESMTGQSYVAFAAPMVRDGQAVAS
ncbi:hypothetical protein [Paraburkholderia sp. BL27I4N3]|uniref:hypothetical protein n=1 Tax=Paraburkholderia sp. BL27I4N3 TaxID=1938805 RepID=UPI000E242949|nr:hypothetical protein [Paraburkholderia sp. BL27I4N3]